MLWLLTVATTAVLVVIAMFVKDIARVPTVARPAALSASARTVSRGTTPGGARHRVSARHTSARGVTPASDRHRVWPVLSAALLALARRAARPT